MNLKRLATIATCTTAFAASALASNDPKTAPGVLRFEVDTQVPSGFLKGAYAGAAYTADKNTFKIAAGQTNTYRKEPDGKLSSVFTPTVKLEANHQESFWGDRLKTSLGLSYSRTERDETYYGSDHASGTAVTAYASLKTTPEVTMLAGLRQPLGGNLPFFRYGGATVQPFAQADNFLKDVRISAYISHTISEKTYVRSRTLIAGYQWTSDAESNRPWRLFAGIAYGRLAIQNRATGNPFIFKAYYPNVSASLQFR